MADNICRQSFPYAAIHLTLWGLTRTLMYTLLWALGNSNPVSRKQEILRLFKGQSQDKVPQVLFQVLWGLEAQYSTGMSLFSPPQSPDEGRVCSILPSGGHSLASPESSARGRAGQTALGVPLPVGLRASPAQMKATGAGQGGPSCQATFAQHTPQRTRVERVVSAAGPRRAGAQPFLASHLLKV